LHLFNNEDIQTKSICAKDFKKLIFSLLTANQKEKYGNCDTFPNHKVLLVDETKGEVNFALKINHGGKKDKRTAEWKLIGIPLEDTNLIPLQRFYRVCFIIGTTKSSCGSILGGFNNTPANIANLASDNIKGAYGTKLRTNQKLPDCFKDIIILGDNSDVVRRNLNLLIDTVKRQIEDSSEFRDIPTNQKVDYFMKRLTTRNNN